jgi:hypothetical protein
MNKANTIDEVVKKEKALIEQVRGKGAEKKFHAL